MRFFPRNYPWLTQARSSQFLIRTLGNPFPKIMTSWSRDMKVYTWSLRVLWGGLTDLELPLRLSETSLITGSAQLLPLSLFPLLLRMWYRTHSQSAPAVYFPRGLTLTNGSEMVPRKTLEWYSGEGSQPIGQWEPHPLGQVLMDTTWPTRLNCLKIPRKLSIW